MKIQYLYIAVVCSQLMISSTAIPAPMRSVSAHSSQVNAHPVFNENASKKLSELASDVNLGGMRNLLNRGRVDVNYRNEYYQRTPLHQVVSRGNIENEQRNEAIRMLLEAGADVHAEDFQGSTPLHLVAQSNDVEAARLLLNAGARLEAHDTMMGSTPLMNAASMTDPAMTEFLLQQGANVDAVNNRGETALHRAVMMANALFRMEDDRAERTVAVLLKYGAKVRTKSNDGSTPLSSSLMNNEVHTMLRKAAKQQGQPYSLWEAVQDPIKRRAQGIAVANFLSGWPVFKNPNN